MLIKLPYQLKSNKKKLKKIKFWTLGLKGNFFSIGIKLFFSYNREIKKDIKPSKYKNHN